MRDRRNDASENQVKNAERVRQDHALHWLAMLAVAGYAWNLHGPLAALLLLVGLIIIVSATNIALLTMISNLRSIRYNRWGWIVVAALVLTISGATFGNA